MVVLRQRRAQRFEPLHGVVNRGARGLGQFFGQLLDIAEMGLELAPLVFDLEGSEMQPDAHFVAQRLQAFEALPQVFPEIGAG